MNKKNEKTPVVELKPYQMSHPVTGEVVNKYKLLEGHPRQYRFDAKAGKFNINGTEWLDGNSFSFQPIAWRIFTDNILNMGTKNWVEIFFVDAQNCVSAILFHGYSVDNIYRLIEPLYYDDLELSQVIVTATAEKKDYTKGEGPKSSYYIAEFSYKLAEPGTTKTLQEYVTQSGVKIFRKDTLTDIANHKTLKNYYNPFETGEADTLLGRTLPGNVEEYGEVKQ